MTALLEILKKHPFFEELDPNIIEMMANCATEATFQPGTFLFHEGEEADRFFLIRRGRVALELNVPGMGPRTIQTIHEGDVLGWSWLFPPYRWHFDARALDVVRTVVFNGKCLRGKFEENPRLGYEIMKRFAQIIVRRLQATRMQLLDIYGTPKPVQKR